MVKTAEIKEEIKIPDGVQITVEGKTVSRERSKRSDVKAPITS